METGTLYLHIQLIDMKIGIAFLLLLLSAGPLGAQPPAPGSPKPAPAATQTITVPKTIPQIKEALEQSPNPVGYAKQILKKRFKIDTIIVSKTKNFDGIADSLAYTGKERKVYGPYGPANGRFLVQLLAKSTNQFYHIGQIFIDTSVFRYRIADSLGNLILQRIKEGKATFEQEAQSYSMGGEAATKGDLGWIARGMLLMTIEHEILVHKKGDVFMVWSRKGLHIIKKIDDPKQDTGFALMMQVFL
jgi:PPIC-type PPIASE domain